MRLKQTRPSKEIRMGNTLAISRERQEAINAARKLCEKWNDANNIGTHVDYRSVQGSDKSVYRTRTTSDAWVAMSGEAVITVEGRGGSVSLLHLTVIDGP